jgi:4-hydroxybenzoate polyprenyltransferase
MSTRAVSATSGSSLTGLLRALRPGQWLKNAVVLAALIFAKRFTEPAAVVDSLLTLALFCAASASVYLINDLLDMEADRQHPVKSRRPIASGQVSVPMAVGTGAVLALVALGGGWLLSPAVAGVLLAYLLMNLAYSTWLKRVVILDVMVLAAGFLLRAVGGAVVLEVEISHWLILCATLLSLFLGFCKRRNELAVLEDRAGEHRYILREYSFPFLDQMISVVTASTLVAYCFYTLSPEVQEKLGTDRLHLTIPFVLYGIFRYLYLVYHRDRGGSPTRVLYTDRPLLVDVALWALTAIFVLGSGS